MDTPERIIPTAPKRAGMKDWFEAGATAIRNVVNGVFVPGHYADYFDANCGTIRMKHVRGQHVNPHADEHKRHWHVSLQETPVHGAVMSVLGDDFLPTDWHQLLLEWPTLSTDGRLAYTQNERKGVAGGPRTVTTPGRYIKRHWPRLSDDYIRDVVARNGALLKMWNTSDEIVKAVQTGPTSCMQWASCDEDDDWEDGDGNPHPYRVYDPKYGWRMAVRLEPDGSVWGRALVLMKSRGPYVEGETLQGAVFVRSYKKKINEYSYADEALEAWLTHNGATKDSDGWPEGARFKHFDVNDSGNGPWMPYLDGDGCRVEIAGDVVVRDDRGEWGAQNTDGTCDNEGRAGMRQCSHCDCDADEDNGYYIGRYSDDWVGYCCEDEYTMVLGQRGNAYRILNDDAIEVDGYYYDPAYINGNGIVELHDGGYCRKADAFNCNVDGNWYRDEDGVETEDSGMCAECNTWVSDKSGLVYSDNEESTTIDGVTMHPDEVDDDDDDDQAEDDVAAAAARARAARAARQEVRPAVTAEAVEVTSSRQMFEGAPPSVGWWMTWGVWENPTTSFPDATPLFRYWNGARWSSDAREEDMCRGGDFNQAEITRRMNIDAYRAQNEITHYRIRAPWDRDAAPAVRTSTQEYTHSNVHDRIRYRAGLNGRIDVFRLHGLDTWTMGAGARNENLTDPTCGYVPVPARPSGVVELIESVAHALTADYATTSALSPIYAAELAAAGVS